MGEMKIRLEPEVKERADLVQKVLDRMVPSHPHSEAFVRNLKELLGLFESNERPLDDSYSRIIMLNGDLRKPELKNEH